jgi:hypothetical protein
MLLSKAAVAAALALILALPAASPAADATKSAPAKTAPKAEAKPAIDDKAAQALDKACKALAALKSYAFKADVTLDKVYQDGSKIQSGRTMDVSVNRPGAFKVVTTGDEFSAVSNFDGKTFSMSLPGRKAYGQIEAAMDIDGLVETLASKYGIESPLGDLLVGEPCAKMAYLAGFYVGKAKVDGASCDHLFFQGRDVDWQLWVEDASGLPRKLVITEKKLPMAPQFTAVFSGWKTVEPQPALFAFAAPEGFTRDDAVITGAKAAARPKAGKK